MNLEKRVENNDVKIVLTSKVTRIKNRKGVDRELRRLRKSLKEEGYLHDLIKIYCGRGTSPRKLSPFLFGNARYWSGNTETNKRHYIDKEERY